MPADFTDIGIVDLDRKTTWSRAHSPTRDNIIESMAAELPAIVDAANGGADFARKRNDWRARFCAAPTTRAKESDRDND